MTRAGKKRASCADDFAGEACVAGTTLASAITRNAVSTYTVPAAWIRSATGTFLFASAAVEAGYAQFACRTSPVPCANRLRTVDADHDVATVRASSIAIADTIGSLWTRETAIRPSETVVAATDASSGLGVVAGTSF